MCAVILRKKEAAEFLKTKTELFAEGSLKTVRDRTGRTLWDYLEKYSKQSA